MVAVRTPWRDGLVPQVECLMNRDLDYVHSKPDSLLADKKSIRYSMNTTYPKGDSPVDSPHSRSARCSFALLQKSRRNYRSRVWTEALSGIILVLVQSYPVQCERSLTGLVYLVFTTHLVQRIAYGNCMVTIKGTNDSKTNGTNYENCYPL